MTDALLAATTATADPVASPSTTAPTETKSVTPPPAETTVEAKPAEAKVEEKPAKAAPESYDFALPKDMPEGFEKDEAVFSALGEVARELDLSQDSAQKLVDKVWPVMHKRALEQQAKTQDQWRAETKADSEIGGSKLEENLGLAKKAIKAFATDGMQELLDGPLGSHPEVVRFLVKVGRTVSEDRFVGGAAQKGPVDLNDPAAVAAKLYPKSMTQA